MATRTVRLHVLLAHSGVASRRASERLIAAGHVTVNGQRVREMGLQVDPSTDRVLVDGQPLRSVTQAFTYVALNKPAGVVSTVSDPEGRRTVMEIIQPERRIYPVGRLDYDSEGLILLTDDGELTFRLTQARFGVEKEYHALVEGAMSDRHVLALERGVPLDDGMARAVRAELLRREEDASWVRVVLVEGRQRQVRRMLDRLGYTTIRLRRERIGTLMLDNLPLGHWRDVRPKEIAPLARAVGLGSRGPVT